MEPGGGGELDELREFWKVVPIAIGREILKLSSRISLSYARSLWEPLKEGTKF